MIDFPQPNKYNAGYIKVLEKLQDLGFDQYDTEGDHFDAPPAWPEYQYEYPNGDVMYIYYNEDDDRWCLGLGANETLADVKKNGGKTRNQFFTLETDEEVLDFLKD